MSIPPAFIQELLSRVDVVDVVGRYVQLKKGGANFMGLCPFHGEKSPSFSVSPTKQFYHCFGCGANGNAIGFLIEHTGMGFVEAVKDLAQQTGLVVPEEESSPQERAQAAQQRQRQSSLTEVLEKAAQAYTKQLKGSARAVDYLKGRGLSGEVAKAFGLGYAPPGWRHLAGVFPDYQTPLLVESGLVIAPDGDAAEAASEAGPSPGAAGTEARRYDRFRDRIMFPIRNVKGETIGFGGRVLDQGEPKYLNSPETPVFSKGRELYGLFEARTAIRLAGYALVTEGYMDVVALAQLGFGNAVATLGTACTAEHVHKLFRFTDAVVFSFDGDGAGRRAARKALDAALPLAGDTRSVKFLFLPPEHDPDSFVRANGSEAFAECVRQAVPLSRFLLDAASADCDLSSAEGRARMAAQARPLWNGLPDGALKRQLLGELADLINLDSQDLHQLWQQNTKPWAEARPPTGDGAKRKSRSARSGAGESGPGSGGRDWAAPRGRQQPNPYHEAGPILRGPAKGGRRRGLTSRADRAVGLLLANPKAWEQLSSDDHAMLAHLAAPHGPLFAWLEAQLLEHGAQPWAALREGLRGHAHEAFALGQVEQAMSPEEEPDPESGELLDVMQRLRMDEWQRECTELSALAATDPDARRRLQAVYALISAQKNTAV